MLCNCYLSPYNPQIEEKEGGALLLETNVEALNDDGEEDEEMSGVMILTLVKV